MREDIIFLNVPRVLAPRFRRVTKRAAKVFSRYFKLRKPVDIVLLYDPMYPLKGRVAAFGYPLENRERLTLMVRLGIFLFRQRPPVMENIVETTVFHELVHFLRKGRPRAKVKECLIEEGIAAFTTTQLYGTPPGLWPPAKHAEAARLWRRAKPHLEASFSKFARQADGTSGLPLWLYRLGDYIVASYAARRPGLTWRELVELPPRTLLGFAKRLFNQKDRSAT